MTEEHEDALDALNIALSHAKITAQQTVVDNSPPSVQQLAELQVGRIELEIRQLQCRASAGLEKIDVALDGLELELCDKRIAKATCETENAPAAQQHIADLEIELVVLKIEQHNKRARRLAVSQASTVAAMSSSESSVAHAAPSVAAAAFATPSSAAAFDLSRPALLPAHTRLGSPAPPQPRAAPSPLDLSLAAPSPTGSPNRASLDTALAVDQPIDLQPAANDNGAPIAALSSPPPQDEGAQSPPRLPDDDALDAGDIERQLTGAPDADGVKIKTEPQPVRGAPTTAQCIEIDDDGTARNVTPPLVTSGSVSASDHGDEKDDLPSDEDEEESFPLSGSPRAPKSVLAARNSGLTTPSKTSASVASSKNKNSAHASPMKKAVRTSPSKPPINAHSAPAATQSKKKTGGRKEPVTEPERWVYRLHNFGAVILQEACDWPEETCRVASMLWAEVFVWEHINKFESGAQKAPSLPASIGTILSKSRFGPTPVGVYDKAPDFLRQLAVCLEAIRDSHFADVRQMHGLHGLAVVARSLLEARRSREDFDKLFRPLALELTAVLEALSAASLTLTHTGVVDGVNVNATIVGGTVLAALQARPNYHVQTATAALDNLQGRTRQGKGKKRDASHLSALEASPSKQAKND